MRTLEQALQVHFRKPGRGHDNLPRSVQPLARNQGRHALSLVMADMGFTTGIEIGTRFGASARSWCLAMPNLHLFCIDPYAPYSTLNNKQNQERAFNKAQHVLAEYDVRFIRQPSSEAVGMFEDGSVDFVYIDGNHGFDAVVRDIVGYVPKVRVGGLVLVHDYFHFHGGGVVVAVDGYTRSHAIDPWYVTFDVSPTAFWQRGAERL